MHVEHLNDYQINILHLAILIHHLKEKDIYTMLLLFYKRSSNIVFSINIIKSYQSFFPILFYYFAYIHIVKVSQVMSAY